MRSVAQIFVFVLTLTLVGTVAAAQPPGGQQTRDAVIQEITIRGTVEAVDHTARTVRLRGDQGNIITLDVPPSVTRFDSVKVGDVVTMAYYDRVNIRPKPEGEPAVDRVVDPTTTITPGLLPGGVRSTQRVTTVKIDSWDPVTRMVGFTTSSGQSYTRRVSETIDASILSGLKVGDRVDVTRTEAVRLNVETLAAPSAQPLPAVVETWRKHVSISFLWGPDNQFSGKVFQAGSGLFNGVTPISFNETSYDDIYGRMGLFKIGVGYRFSPRTEAIFNFVLSRSSGDFVQVGTFGDEAAPLFAQLDDYSYWGFEGGQRFYFARVRFTPFVGYTVGINRFTHIDGDFTAAAVGTQPAFEAIDERIFDSSWAFSFGPTGGVLVGVGPFEIQGEVGLRYMGGLSDIDILVNANLRDINAESSRWSFPVLVGARFRF
jgi:hypothetical protein